MMSRQLLNKLWYRAVPAARLGGLAAPTEKYTDITNAVSSPTARQSVFTKEKGWRRREKFAKGAFDKLIDAIATGRKEVKALVGHDPSRQLGSTADGTLTLGVADNGLNFELELPDNPLGLFIRELAEQGKLRGVSPGFNPPEEKNVTRKPRRTRRNRDSQPQLTTVIPTTNNRDSELATQVVQGADETNKTEYQIVTSADVNEISIITSGETPAYRDTTAELRSLEDKKLKLKLLCAYYDLAV